MPWLNGWSYRKSHEVVGSTIGAQTDYQVRIKVHYGSGADSDEDVYLNGKCRTDFGDIRFTSDDGVTELSYWMEEKVDGDYAIFWVKVPSIPASPDTTQIYIYYDNPTATTTSNGFNTFLLFDDFEDGVWTDRWTEVVAGGSVTEASGVLTLETADGAVNEETVESVGSFLGQTVEVMARARLTRHWNRGEYLEILIIKDADNWLRAAPIDADVNQIRAWECGAGTSDYTRITGFLLNKNNWHRIVVRGTDTELYVDYYDTVADIHREVTNPLNYFSWDPASNYKIRLRNHHWATGTGGDRYETDEWDWIAVRKYVDPEPSHGAWGSEETPPPVVVIERFQEEGADFKETKFGATWT